MLRNVIMLLLVSVGGVLLVGQVAAPLIEHSVADSPETPDTPPVTADNHDASTGPGATLSPDGNGHFRAATLVNGQSVTMIVDTGASNVVLTEADARMIGISPASSQFSGSATTAGGTVKVAPVTLDRVAVNGIERRNVAAVVAQGSALPASLLGQSYLSRLGEVRIANGQMTLQD